MRHLPSLARPVATLSTITLVARPAGGRLKAH